ncbi:MAG: hypothetical protein ABI603_16250, partial [Acidobacteriota bacterium]
TAQPYPGYDALTQGTGFLNAWSAVDFARFFKTAQAGDRYRLDKSWSRSLIWGTHRLTGGVIRPDANAWKLGSVWGAPKDPTGMNIVWGTIAPASEDNIVWGTTLAASNIVWGTAIDRSLNIVWGTAASPDFNIVWGTSCSGADCPNVVWGSKVKATNIVWGTLVTATNIVWGTALPDFNIVWGTSGDVAGVTWATSGEDTSLFDNPASDPINFDATPFDSLFDSSTTTTTTATPVTSTVSAIGGLL